MNRRRMLALLGPATVLAGCRSLDDGPATGTTTDGTPPGGADQSPADTETSPTDSSLESLDTGDAFRTASGEILRASEVHLARSVFDLVHPTPSARSRRPTPSSSS